MNVAIYARVSSEKQDTDLSISAQLKALREYSAKNGHCVVREFVDEAETGRTTARPAFREMVSLARRPKRPFDMILIWKYSRFARSRQDSIVYKTMLKKAGVQVVSINEHFDDTPTGRLLEAIIESLDEFYSDNLGEEVTRGMRESVSRGFYLSSRPPYGYRKVRVRDGAKERTRLEPDPCQASIVVDVFNQVLNGKGLTEITKELNRKGIPGPKGRDWRKTGLHKILNNEIYTGTFIWGRNSKRGLEPVRAENACQPIVNRETFDRVRKLMKERSPVKVHPRRVASPFLLSGLARCGYCGKNLIGRYAKGGRFAYYVCGTLDKKGAGSCQAQYLNASRFEALIIEKIGGHIFTRENLVSLIQLVNEEMDSAVQQYYDEIDITEMTVADVNRRLERLYDALETGKIGLDDLVPRIRELRKRQEELNYRRIEIENLVSNRRVECADLETVTDYVEDLHELLSEGTLTERRAFIRSFVKDVRVNNNEVVLTYTMPLPPERDRLEGEGVLPFVHYSGR